MPDHTQPFNAECLGLGVRHQNSDLDPLPSQAITEEAELEVWSSLGLKRHSDNRVPALAVVA